MLETGNFRAAHFIFLHGEDIAVGLVNIRHRVGGAGEGFEEVGLRLVGVGEVAGRIQSAQPRTSENHSF